MKKLKDRDLTGFYTISLLTSVFGFFGFVAVHMLIPTVVCTSIMITIMYIILKE